MMKACREDDLTLIAQALSQTPLERLAANEAFVDFLLSVRPDAARKHLLCLAREMIARRTLPVLKQLPEEIEARRKRQQGSGDD